MATRATDADREAFVGLLRRHLIDQRVTLDEYADRVEQIWDADSREAIEAVLADLPLLAPETVNRRGRRHGEGDAPRVTWRPTPERFRDPTTNRVMRVWVDVASAERHYVAEV